MSSYEFFAPCPRGLEAPLAAELSTIGKTYARLEVGAVIPGGVPFAGAWDAAQAANLHSRMASRVLLKIGQRGYRNEDDVYDLVFGQPWEDWFGPEQTLRVDLNSIKSPLRSLEFVTLRIKDAVCDRLRERTGKRPDIDTAHPDVRVFAFLSATDCTVYLDTSGEPLFKRGWRLDKGAAPLRENLAAGILSLSGWAPGTPLYDPMCGSGTFIAEAAQTVLGIAPGSARGFAFEHLRIHEAKTWKALRAQAAEARAAAQASAGLRGDLEVYGSDISGDMLVKARANLARAGVGVLPLKQLDARSLTPPSERAGILVANPPYGERLEVRGRGARERWGTQSEREREGDGFRRAHDPEDLADDEFFRAFGDSLKQRFSGWRAYVLSSDRRLPGQMRLRESTKTPLFNGALECRLFRFDLVSGALKKRGPESA